MVLLFTKKARFEFKAIGSVMTGPATIVGGPVITAQNGGPTTAQNGALLRYGAKTFGCVQEFQCLVMDIAVFCRTRL